MPRVQNLPSAHQEARASTWSPSLPLSQTQMQWIHREGLCLSPEQSKVELSRGSLACGPFLWTEEAGRWKEGLSAGCAGRAGSQEPYRLRILWIRAGVRPAGLREAGSTP